MGYSLFKNIKSIYIFSDYEGHTHRLSTALALVEIHCACVEKWGIVGVPDIVQTQAGRSVELKLQLHAISLKSKRGCTYCSYSCVLRLNVILQNMF